MKKLLLLAVLAVFAINTNAQGKKTVKKITAQVEYVAQEMKLDAPKQAFLQESLLANYTAKSKEIKGLSKEEKKVVSKRYKKEFVKTLEANFSKAEIKQIETLLKKYNKENKKKKK